MTSSDKQKIFRIATLGCRTNQYESQVYQEQLERLGWRAAQEGEVADLSIVNSCTVTASADSASRSAIRQLVRLSPEGQVAVTGCFAQSKPEEVLAISGVTQLIPNAEKEELVAKMLPQELPEFSITRFEAHTRAFVKVQDGCNSFCSYCVIPYVRGRSRSRSVDEVVTEVEALVANGYQEVVITGINVGDFDGGEKVKARLADLIRAVDGVPGIRRVRLSSIDPDEVDEVLMEAILSGKHTCPSLHLVLQSGSDLILKRMNRKYTRLVFLETVRKLRAQCPDFTFTTDIIVGFPGERQEDFEQTLEVMQEVRFAKVHMFPYSDRPKTRSRLMPDKVSPLVMQQRKAELLRRAEQQAFWLHDSFVGRRMEVLTESIEGDWMHGHTANFLSVRVAKGDLLPNQLIEVELMENSPLGLLGRVV